MAKTLTLAASVSVLALIIAGSAYVHQVNLSAAIGESGFDSVEIGIAELSPNGEKGGYAIPASGSSRSCSLTLTPSSMVQGAGNVQLSWSPGINMNVTRNGAVLGARSSGWVDVGAGSNPPSSALPPGTYTYSLSGSSDSGICAKWEENWVSDDKGNWYVDGWYCAHNETYNYSCQRDLIVTSSAVPPTLSFSASNPNPPYNTSTNLTWSVGGSVTSCTASGNWSGSKSTSGGTEATGNLTASRTYNLQCTGPGGNSPLRTVTVTPGAPGGGGAAPSGSINATPSGVTTGGTTVIDWDTNDTTSCTVSGNGDSWSGTSNSGQTSSVFGSAGSYTYSLICNGTNGSTNVIVDTVMVSVTDATYPNLVSGNIFLNSGTLQNGQTVTFRSTVDNVGGVNTPASSPSFHDNFTYQWNGTGGAWQPIGGHIPHNMMTPANAVRTDTSVGLPLGQTGTLYIQHCVDSQSQVDESASGETGNCVVSMPGFNVTAAPVGLSITSCNATPSPAEEGELVTWQANVTGGTPPYNYSWSGTGGLSGGGNPKTITYATAGTKNAQVTVTDNASGSFGPFNCTALTVEDAPPTVNFKVCDDTANDINDGTCEDEKSVAEGTPLKLIWTSDADACDPVPPPNFSTGSSANGSDVVTAFPGETKYKILCRRGTGATENVVDVSAGGPPTIDADPDRVRFNEPFDIEWDVTDSDLATCTLSGGTLPATPPSSSGSLEQTIGGETTFSITCEFGTASVTVELIPGVFES